MITYESICEEIKKKIEELNTTFSFEPEYETCREYAENNRLSKIEDIVNIDMKKFMQCFLYVKTQGNISMGKADIISGAIMRIFGSLEEKEFERLVYILIVLCGYVERDFALDYITETSNLRAGALLLSMDDKLIPLCELSHGKVKDIHAKECLKELRELEQSKGGIKAIVEFLEDEPDLSMDVMSFFKTRKCIETDLRVIEEENKKLLGVPQREKRRSIRDFFHSTYNMSVIHETHNAVESYVMRTNRRKTEYDRSRSKKLHIYERVLTLLEEANQKEEVTNAKEIIKGIPDDDVKRMILIWISQKNHVLYQKLEKQLEDLNSHSINLYIAVLKRYRISMDVSEISSIMHHSPEALDEILRFIPSGVFRVDQLLRIIQITNTMVAGKVRNYLNIGYIESSCLLDNMDLFSSSMEKIKRLEETCAVLSKYGINPQIFSKTPELFWDPNNIFPKNVTYLCDYNLISAIRTSSELDFLLDPSMVEKIDLFIELGYYNFIEQNIGLLNFSKERIQRLELLRAMHIPIDDVDTLYEVLSNSKFIVKDDKLDQYLLDVVPYKKPLELNLSVEDLENRSHDKVILLMGDCVISLPKIKRRVSQGESIGQAIFYGRRYSEEEYDQIVRGISSYSRR